MGLPFLFAGALSFPVGWDSVAHSHPHVELILVTAGSMSVTIGADEAVEVGVGDLVIYPPLAIHRERNAGRRELEMIYLHTGLEFRPLPSPQLNDRAGRISQLLRWLLEDQADGSTGVALASWMGAITAQIDLCATPRPSPLADAIRVMLRHRLEYAHSVVGLARAVGLGPRQFLRRYREETGTTPMADLRRLRCEAAADLVVSTTWPLERIALSVGFCDEFHLSKVFRARYGMPPGRMRRSHAVR